MIKILIAWLSAFLLGFCAFGAPAPSTSDNPVMRPSTGCGVSPALTPGETGIFSVRVGELDREYRLHLPPSYDRNISVPMVLDFHGYTGTAKHEEHYTGLSRHADEHGYAVVYPQSTAFITDTGQRITSWNDLAGNASPGPEGPICSETASKYPSPPECGENGRCNWATCHDDLGFIEQLLDELSETLCIDLDRVYATGMSNGGMFVHRLGCALPERFAAIVPVGGTLARGFNCAPDKSTPLSMMNIYGRRDHFVSQRGDASSDGYYYTSAEDVMSKWASSASQGCDPSSTPRETPPTGKLDLSCIQRDNCSTGAEVMHCTWDGGHDWPQGETPDVANQVIWEFFAKHSRAKYRAAEMGRPRPGSSSSSRSGSRFPR